jgi:hypothetical protein
VIDNSLHDLRLGVIVQPHQRAGELTFDALDLVGICVEEPIGADDQEVGVREPLFGVLLGAILFVSGG